MSYHKVLIAVALIALVVIAAAPKSSDANGLKKFSSIEELTSFLEERGTDSTMLYDRAAAESIAPASQDAKTSAADYSSTNVQVQDVDEADIVKNDGKYIYSVSGTRLFITEAYPPEDMKLVSTIEFANASAQEIYVIGDRLVVFGNSYEPHPFPAMDIDTKIGIIAPLYQKSFINVYDISDRANPVLKRNHVLDGYYAKSRMTDGYVYAIINVPANGKEVPVFSPQQEAFPEIYYFDVPDYSYTYTNIISFDPQADEGMDNQVYLTGYSTALYVSQDNIYIGYQKQLESNYVLKRTVNEIIIPSVDSETGTKVRQIMDSDMPDYEKEYTVQNAIENWTNSLTQEEQKNLAEKAMAIYRDAFMESQKTVIHRISIDNGNIQYAANGEVPGMPLNQFSMDEHDGYFRIATTTNNFWGGWGFGGIAVRSTEVVSSTGGSSGIASTETASSPVMKTTEDTIESGVEEPVQELLPDRLPRDSSKNNVYVLDMGMNVVGKIEGLAEGETIHSARFMGDRAYLVTFRQTDPLFAIDLSEPANPKVLGELKVPGVSQYLHPYGENYLIGIGHDATDEGRLMGLKLSLFDISDMSNPKEVSTQILGDKGSFSYATYDHKAFLFSAGKGLLVIPVYLTESDYKYVWQGAYVFAVSEAGFELKGKIAHQYNGTEYDYYQSEDSVNRALYMDNALYTLSQSEIKATDLTTMEEINSLKLPVDRPVYYIM
ncbi:MAG: beta-propeller domain-containing protein [Candidatus Aenigmarchaeota archaeon]|nr:beta-propeller domain-containing protein [Candidatus Aenigmarchaeota archaeon]